MPPPYLLTIFDCDGVLTDSETLGNRVMVEMLGEQGLVLSLPEAIRLFRGLKMAECVRIAEERRGRALPADFVPELRRRMGEAFARELQPIPGVIEALEQLHGPRCVASNGPHEKMAISLKVTGLQHYFGDRIFSAYEVGSWKPAPDLYLHAACQCGVAPKDCAVIEDSATGVEAGVAAGMTVFGFAPEGENEEELAKLGARTFRRMAELPRLLEGVPQIAAEPK